NGCPPNRRLLLDPIRCRPEASPRSLKILHNLDHIWRCKRAYGISPNGSGRLLPTKVFFCLALICRLSARVSNIWLSITWMTCREHKWPLRGPPANCSLFSLIGHVGLLSNYLPNVCWMLGLCKRSTI